jgi:hypothetical protein
MSGMSCFWNNNLNGKSTGKGKRLIVSHAVTPDGPVCERDPVTNVWHDNLMWKGNMPHPKEFEKREANELFTCKLLGKAQKRTLKQETRMHNGVQTR